MSRFIMHKPSAPPAREASAFPQSKVIALVT